MTDNAQGEPLATMSHARTRCPGPSGKFGAIQRQMIADELQFRRRSVARLPDLKMRRAAYELERDARRDAEAAA